MKLTLRQKSRVMDMLGVAGLVLLGGACIFNDRVIWPLVFVGFGLMLASLVLQSKWWRCPCCQTYLGRIASPDFCPHCGEKIDYDAT